MNSRVWSEARNHSAGKVDLYLTSILAESFGRQANSRFGLRRFVAALSRAKVVMNHRAPNSR